MSKLLDNLLYLLKIVLRYLVLLFKLYATKKIPIIIYQMGKVGSSSVMKSLQKRAIWPLFHAHFLLKIANNRSFYNPKVYEILHLKRNEERQVRLGEFLYKKLIVPKKQLKIISLTREPIGRNIAAFFQNFERETGKKYELSNFTPQELMDIFVNYYPHSIPLDWFDNYFKPFLGIDVYEYPFPKEQGLFKN
jgi:hypothetical protein